VDEVNAHILTIGDELLIGQVINTNQAFIAERLNSIGVDVGFMATVGDTMDAVLGALRTGWESSDVTVVTGGLGPTHDDITRSAVCAFFGTDLVPNEEVRRHIGELMKKRNLPVTAAAEDQSLVPRSAEVVPNPVGTAPGLLFRDGGKIMFVLPGVPYEMKEMIDGSVIPFLAPLASEQVIRHRTLLTTGIPESFLAAQLGDLDQLLGPASLAFLPSPAGVRLRITVHGRTPEEADGVVHEVEGRIRSKVSRYIYGTDDEDLEAVLGRILALRKLTIAIAESCTGGLIAHRLTNVSGSSAYFERGVVTYSDASKTDLLGVPAELIATRGAVSREVAESMASGVRGAAGTDIGLSTTGIAGPTGGTPSKPVGTVWIGIADPAGTLALKFNFGEGRARVKERASQAALELVRRRLLKLE
jgi:nicotinamide-nucleotide amidase